MSVDENIVGESISLEDRMKDYEGVYTQYLNKKSFYILRVDGKAFHTYTKKFKDQITEAYPFSSLIAEAMDKTTEALFKEVQSSLLAYTQSDEISILFTDTMSENAEIWFGGKVQKIASVAASIATATFNSVIASNNPELSTPPALFDARVFEIPGNFEIPNYFLWRAKDAIRNSLQSYARVHFSHAEMKGMSCDEMALNLRFMGYEPDEIIRARDKIGKLLVKSAKAVETDDGDLVNRRVITSPEIEENTYLFWMGVISSSMRKINN